MLMSSSIQVVYWKYIVIFFFLFSSHTPFFSEDKSGLTFCSPSALVQSCRVACCLSKPGDGCDTLTGLAPNVLQVFILLIYKWGRNLVDINFLSILRHLSSILGVNRRRLVSSLVLLLSTILLFFLNFWNQFLLPLNFAASSVSQHASIFNFILFLNQSLDTLLPAVLCS